MDEEGGGDVCAVQSSECGGHGSREEGLGIVGGLADGDDVRCPDAPRSSPDLPDIVSHPKIT